MDAGFGVLGMPETGALPRTASPVARLSRKGSVAWQTGATERVEFLGDSLFFQATSQKPHSLGVLTNLAQLSQASATPRRGSLALVAFKIPGLCRNLGAGSAETLELEASQQTPGSACLLYGKWKQCGIQI